MLPQFRHPHTLLRKTLCSILFLCTLLLVTAAKSNGAANSSDITLRDEKRGRDIECRVHFPAGGQKLPLIVFSHGFGGDRTAFAAISQHVAEHGFVVIHPSHNDGFGRSSAQRGLGAFKGLRRGAELASQLDDPVKIEGRVEDIKYLLDHIDQIVDKVPALKSRIDTTRIGVGGHSYGAYTSMLIGGVTVDLGGKKARSFADPRVRCIMPVSGQGTGQQGLTETSWSSLKLPMLTMTGSRDQGATGQSPDWKQEPFKYSPPGDKYLVFIEGANHFSFGGFGGRETDVTRIVSATSLAFWQAYLKDDDNARKSLKSADFAAELNGAVITSK